jgi:hypothetical protein
LLRAAGVTAAECRGCKDLVKSVFARFGKPAPITHAQDVAEAVWPAVNDPSSPMRIPAGADAVSWAESS